MADEAGNGGAGAAVAEPAGGAGASPAPAPSIPEAGQLRGTDGRFQGQPPAGSDTASVLDWRSALPEEYRSNPRVQQARTLGDYVKRAIDTEAFVGRSIQLPPQYDPANPDMEALTPILGKLGRPDKATEYQVEWPALPEGLAWSEAAQQQALEAAHAAGLAPWQLQRYVQFEAQRLTEGHNMMQAQRAEAFHAAEVALQKEFGASLPRLKQGAQHFWQILGSGVFGGERGTRAMEKLAAAGLDNDVDIIASFANVAERMREAEFLVPESPQGFVTAQDIDTEIRTLVAKQYSQGQLTAADERRLTELYDHKVRMQAR